MECASRSRPSMRLCRPPCARVATSSSTSLCLRISARSPSAANRQCGNEITRERGNNETVPRSLALITAHQHLLNCLTYSALTCYSSHQNIFVHLNHVPQSQV